MSTSSRKPNPHTQEAIRAAEREIAGYVDEMRSRPCVVTWCADHEVTESGACHASRVWHVGGVGLSLSSLDSEQVVPDVNVDVRSWGGGSGALTPTRAARLAGALDAASMLGQHVTTGASEYWMKQLDDAEGRDRVGGES